MGGGGKGGGGETSSEVRYAPYIEDAHAALINLSAIENNRLLAKAGEDGSTGPYAGLAFDNIDTAFFSSGYTIASYPSLWDMFGKFVAGLSVEALWDQIYDDSVNAPVTDAMITAESALLQDDIDTVALPKMNAGYRDMNAVMSSSFLTARTLIQDQKLKAVAKFSAQVKQHAMDIAVQRWGRHLEWNNHVVEQYRVMNQLFWATKFDLIDATGQLNTRNELWRFTVLDHHRLNVASLNGAVTSKTKGQEASTASRAIGGALGGAAMGAMAGAEIGTIGGLPGAAVGAVAGGVLGLAGGLLS